MKNILWVGLYCTILLFGCTYIKKSEGITEQQKEEIRREIQREINAMILSVNSKDIDRYMEKIPKDFLIYDGNGEIITRDEQREYILRDWAIIDTTLNNEMKIDSIHFKSRDSIDVFTQQRWERIMFQRDGVTKDTVITTQLHKELWKKKKNGWIGYEVEELGGEVFINGQKYEQN